MHRFSALLLLAASAPTLLLLLLPHLDAEAAGRWAVVSLATVPLLIVDVALFAILLWRRNGWSWYFGALILFSLPSLSGHIPSLFGKSANENNGQRLRIVSWNVDNFLLSEDTLAAAARHINGYKPDIICFQERPHTNLLAWNKVRAAFPTHRYAVKNSREDEVLNLAVLSRWPLRNLREWYFDGSYNKILSVDVLIGSQTVRLFNAHLQTTGASSSNEGESILTALTNNAVKRNHQADMLAQAVRESRLPVIVCGDFNDTPTSYTYNAFEGSLQDCFLETGHCLGGSYQPWGGLLRIDYTLVSKDFSVGEYKLTSNNWSDHKLQECELYLQKETKE